MEPMHVNTEHSETAANNDAGDLQTPNLPKEEFTSYARAELGEALSEALIALYKGGPTRPSEALNFLVDAFGATDCDQQQQLSNMRPPHRIKEEFVKYVEASGFPRQLQKAMVMLRRAYVSGEMSDSDSTATEYVRERLQQARRKRVERQQFAAHPTSVPCSDEDAKGFPHAAADPTPMSEVAADRASSGASEILTDSPEPARTLFTSSKIASDGGEQPQEDKGEDSVEQDISAKRQESTTEAVQDSGAPEADMGSNDENKRRSDEGEQATPTAPDDSAVAGGVDDAKETVDVQDAEPTCTNFESAADDDGGDAKTSAPAAADSSVEGENGNAAED